MSVNSVETQPTSTIKSNSHEHAWTVESRHQTSEGELNYLRCAHCPARQMVLKSFVAQIPVASHELA